MVTQVPERACRKLMTMRFLSVILFISLLVPGGALADESEKAKASGSEYLKLLDEDKYASVYNDSVAVVKGAMKADEFAAQVKAAKAQVGQRKSREFAKLSVHDNLGGLKGKFYTLRYTSSYGNVPNAAELLTVTQESGKWKFAGYQVLKAEAVPKGF